MNKIYVLVFLLLSSGVANAQKKSKLADLTNRANDLIAVQLTKDSWTGTPDSIGNKLRNFSKGLGVYIMLDKPFKTNNKWSVTYGVGIGSSSIFFNKMNVGIGQKPVNNKMVFENLDGKDYFKKYKLVTVYAELPVELKYTFQPEQDKKTLILGLGAKVGSLLNVHTKGKTVKDAISGADKDLNILKVSNKTYFNKTRIMLTGRIGLGKFSLIGSYQINSFLKEGAGSSSIRPLQIGIQLSGL